VTASHGLSFAVTRRAGNISEQAQNPIAVLPSTPSSGGTARQRNRLIRQSG